MSAEPILIAADLIDREVRLEPRLLGAGEPIADERDWVVRRAWKHYRNELANEIRIQLRYSTVPKVRTSADRCAGLLDSIDAMLEPSAGDLVQAGYEVDEALEIVDRHTAELHKRMGGKP